MSLLLVAPWLTGWDPVGPLMPSARRAGILNPLLFLGVACCLLDAGLRRTRPWLHRLAVVCAVALLLLPGTLLVESLTGASFGLNLAAPGQVATADNPNPGRLSPNASLAFVLCGLAFWLLGRPWTRARGALFVTAAVVVAAIGLSGLLGYLLGLERLYRLASFNRMLPTTAFGFAVAGIALWMLRLSYGPPAAQRLDHVGRRIDRSFIAVLTLVAACGGIAGFALLRDTFETSVAQSMQVTASTNEAALVVALESSLWFPKLIATRPTVRQSLMALDRDPADKAAQAQLQNIADSFSDAQLSATSFYDVRGRRIVTTGTPATNVRVVHPLLVSGQQAQLVWDDGYLLRASSPVVAEGRQIGHVETEQRLLPVDRLLAQLRASGPSLDAAICGRDAAGIVCAPTKFQPVPFRMSLDAAEGTASQTMLRAIRGEKGVAFARDPRGANVVSATLPVAGYGLAFGVKSDVDDLYAPLRDKLQWLVLALIGVVWVGVVAQRSQVRPVLDQLVASERRLKAILDEQTELVSLSRPDGLLTYVNPAYARYFGRDVAAMAGTNLYDYVLPDDRAAVARHLGSVFATGSESSSENRMTTSARGEVWVAWSNSLQRDESGQPLLRSIGRDITERRETEIALAASREQLLRQAATLRSVTESIPAIVAVVDADLRYRFVNSAFEQWIGRSRVEIVGRSVAHILGADDWAQIEPWARRALAGETVQFERHYPSHSAARHLRLHYIPSWSAGAVDGFVGIGQDITDQREEHHRLLQLSERDTLTGLLNRAGFERRVEQEVAEGRGADMALLYIDLDHFKAVNDNFGHPAGDQVLQQFARRVQAVIRPTDAMARLGGDEFAVLLFGVHEASHAQTLGDKVITAACTPFEVDGHELHIGASVGVAVGVKGQDSWRDLVARADNQLYRAKEAGRGQQAGTTDWAP